MAANDSVFSIRLVVADFYMEKPLHGLDPVYSEFRGREIKRVPIIRVFGSNSQGQKTCMHVHGVFPYFYIPYDQKDFESVNQAIYLIAMNLDKAINISLSQGSSNVQHVFKVQLVKGIPFYGYHRSEHQYLKIYLFNPRFVRRAANLLQNGAIMNKNFHPHEAHVPYILQFMIDYNLYGMSYIHVPLEIVKFRRSDAGEVIPFQNLKETQILDVNMTKKLSCSRLECDIGSNFILNRFQLIAKTSSTHTNPGIESIWHDEKLRRQKLALSFGNDEEKLKAIPALEVPSTQERPNVYPTESEIFYRTALVSKLLAMETSQAETTQVSDQTINCTLQTDISNMAANATLNASLSMNRQQKRTFNLTKMLQNSVYPEECSQDKNLVNASFVENHLSNNNVFQQSLNMNLTELESNECDKLSEDESIFLDDTIVDEDLILSLTQSQKLHVPHNATLRQEDVELLDILQQLEEDNNDNKIDLDSSLAPLTQDNKNFALSPEELDKQTAASAMQQLSPQADSDEENENDDTIHDFSIALENLDDLILKLTQSGTETSLKYPLPQTDGSDDLPKTPTKTSATTLNTVKTPPRTPTTPRQRRLTLTSPSRSPRTPKSGHKYKPLPLIITNRSTGKQMFPNPSNDTKTPCKTSVHEKVNNLPSMPLRKKLAMTELRRKSISVENYTEDNQNVVPVTSESTSVSKRPSRKSKDLDKTHVTCNLTPRRTNDKILKVYNVDHETNVNMVKGHEQPKNISPKVNDKKRKPKDCVDFKTKECGKEINTIKEVPGKTVSPRGATSNASIIYDKDDNDDSEEILDSDQEAENPSLQLAKTPNLKRLRRSFRSIQPAKRQKIIVNRENVEVINSSKFENLHTLSMSSNEVGREEKNTTSNRGNSTKFAEEISKTEQDTEESKVNKRLNKLTQSSNHGQSIDTLEVLSRSVHKERIPVDKKVLRKSTRNRPNSAMEINSEFYGSSAETMPEVTIASSTSVTLRQDLNKPSLNIPPRKCRVRLKRIGVTETKTIKDLGIMEISEETKHTTETTSFSKVFETEHNKESVEVSHENSEEIIYSSIETVHEDISQQPVLRVAESFEVLAETTQKEPNTNTYRKNIPSLELVKNSEETETYSEITHKTKQDKSLLNGFPERAEGFNDLKTLEETKKLMPQAHTDNLLKSLLKLTSTESKEWCLTASPRMGASSNIPFAQTPQSTSAELITEFTLHNSSDEEITETPPQPPVNNNGENTSKAVSLYENFHQSPQLFSQNSSPSIMPPNKHLKNSKIESSESSTKDECISLSSSNEVLPLEARVVLTPLDLPPTREEVIKGCVKLKIHEYEFQQPFYSNPDDVTKQKEVGFTILQINSNKLNDLEEFQSILGSDIKGLAAWRRNQLLKLGGPAMLTKYRNTQRIREYFATQKIVAITPQISAPTRQEVKVWLKARELLKTKGVPDEADKADSKAQRLAEEDSPIKIRRQKVTLMLANDGAIGDGDDSDNSLDCSSRSLTLTPMTPNTPLAKEPLNDKINKSFTPLTTKVERIPLDRLKAASKRSNRRVLRRVSLNQKMREALERRETENNDAASSKSVDLVPNVTDDLDAEKYSRNSRENSHENRKSFDKNGAFQKHNNRRVLRRIPLNSKMQEALEKRQIEKKEKSVQKGEKMSQNSSDGLDTDKSSQKSTEMVIYSKSSNEENALQKSPISCKESGDIPTHEESILPHTQTSETSVSSQTALAEMERSSFMRQIEQLDVTVGGSNNSTLNNTFGFKVALENLQQAKADIEFNFLTIITLEVFVATRDDLFPNPQIDEIRCLFYAIENSIPSDHIENDKKLPRTACGYIIVHDSRDTVTKEGRIHGIDHDIEVTIVQTEVEALEALLGLCSRWDADIYAGYEIEMSSWGFVIERAKYLCLNIAPLLSRVPTQKVRDFVDEDRDQFTDLDVEMKLCGRILLDVWRLMRSEIALTSYTFENVMYHIMHKRCPWHSYRTLTEWFSSPSSRWIVIEYYLERVRGTLRLLDQLDLIGRTSEMAKLIGIQFYEVLSRGSQFRVESMMLRIAKPKNLVPISPSVQQRAHMRAPEYLPLILEPQSRFYADPVIVLDFQSLYPSMIIGYNYCFSTCLGRVEHLGQSTPFEFGAAQLRVSPTMLRKLVDRDLITISPCGVVFVKSCVREGILPRMLTEILDTRQMVKQSMKVHKSNSALQRILHSRQLGLKLMANVTYGYTAANFSGRMPAVEVGDTVVAKGRETLERAIKMVEANEKWNVKVVYGDTDSMFVLVPGRNREEAFRIGEEIAEAVTKQNPHPVKLKLEKVYQPCILQTKKRYVGYMYETADQKEPVYEAKGIETVRRDGCPMVAKMLEKVLRILFESADVSQVKQYVCRQFTKLLSGRANIQDLIFAKEFRGMNGYKANACVPALELTRKWIQTDPRRIPRRGERVPFIITNGPPGVPLIRLIRHPHEVLADEGLKINAIYYITKAIIPPLNRCLLLIGADVNEWFTNMPRKILMTPALSVANEVIACPNSKSKKSTISQFFSTTNCIVDCGRQTKHGICDVCNGNATRSTIILQMKISKIERAYLSTQYICQACCGRVGDLKCGSLDCPVLYMMEVKRRDLQQIAHFRNLLEERF